MVGAFAILELLYLDRLDPLLVVVQLVFRASLLGGRGQSIARHVSLQPEVLGPGPEEEKS